MDKKRRSDHGAFGESCLACQTDLGNAKKKYFFFFKKFFFQKNVQKFQKNSKKLKSDGQKEEIGPWCFW